MGLKTEKSSIRVSMRDFCHEASPFLQILTWSRYMPISSHALLKNRHSKAGIYFTKLFSTRIYFCFSQVSLRNFIVSCLMA